MTTAGTLWREPDAPDWQSAVIDSASYTSPQRLAAELEQVFARTWQLAGLMEHLREAGDYLTCEVAGESVLVVNAGADGLRAFYNVCQHRGRELVEPGTCGRSRNYPVPIPRLDLRARRALAGGARCRRVSRISTRAASRWRRSRSTCGTGSRSSGWCPAAIRCAHTSSRWRTISARRSIRRCSSRRTRGSSRATGRRRSRPSSRRITSPPCIRASARASRSQRPPSPTSSGTR